MTVAEESFNRVSNSAVRGFLATGQNYSLPRDQRQVKFQGSDIEGNRRNR